MGLRASGFGPWYACDAAPACDYRVGAHKASGEPLGTPTDAVGREARKRAHAAFDALWRRDYDGNSRRRTRAYNQLAYAMGLPPEECHIARFGVMQCDAVVLAVRALTAAEGADTYPGALLSPQFAPPEGDTSEVEKGLPRWELA